MEKDFELNGGKFESAGGSWMEGLDETAVEGMIGIVKRIAQDYEKLDETRMNVQFSWLGNRKIEVRFK